MGQFHFSGVFFQINPPSFSSFFSVTLLAIVFKRMKPCTISGSRRVKVGVQLDGDMLVAPNCDKLFDATEKHINAEYPYPIMPVHWMARCSTSHIITSHL